MQCHAKLLKASFGFESFFGFSVLHVLVERQSKSGSILRCVVGPCDSDSNSLGKLSKSCQPMEAGSEPVPVPFRVQVQAKAAKAKTVIGYSSDLLTGCAPDLLNLYLHTAVICSLCLRCLGTLQMCGFGDTARG